MIVSDQQPLIFQYAYLVQSNIQLGFSLPLSKKVSENKSAIEGNFKVYTKENNMFEGIAWTDSIDIFPETTGNINNQSKDVQVDNVYQKTEKPGIYFCQYVSN